MILHRTNSFATKNETLYSIAVLKSSINPTLNNNYVIVHPSSSSYSLVYFLIPTFYPSMFLLTCDPLQKSMH